MKLETEEGSEVVTVLTPSESYDVPKERKEARKRKFLTEIEIKQRFLFWREKERGKGIVTLICHDNTGKARNSRS